jgi:hypothetical protein
VIADHHDRERWERYFEPWRTVEGGGVVFSVLVDWGPKIRHALNRIRQGEKRRGMTSHVVYRGLYNNNRIQQTYLLNDGLFTL